MDLFFWRKNKTIDAFASNLANDLYSSIQPELAREFFYGAAGNKKEQKNRRNVDKKIRDVIKHVDQFRMGNSLGVYGKARFHLKFTERLKELGYDEELSRKVNEHIMLKTP